MSNNIAIIDTSNLIHSNYHSMKKNNKYVDYNVLYDRIKKSIDTCVFALMKKRIPIVRIVLCLDSKSFRNQIYSAYKDGRKHDEGLTSMLHTLYTLMKKDYECLHFDGLEADDIAFLLSIKYSNFVLISEDGDWMQMLRNDNYLYKPFKKKFVHSSEVDTYYESLDKLILGCTSDNIPKAHTGRLGPKTLKKYYDEVKDTDNPLYFLTQKLEEKGIKLVKEKMTLNKTIALYSINTYRNLVKNFDEIWKSI